MHLLLLIILVGWVLALARTLTNLVLIPRLRPTDELPQRQPFVSIVVPARDEARVIERTVRALLAQRYDDFEVIVIDDRSVDETGEILRRIAASDARLVVVEGVEPPPGWLGKPAALHRGASRARGEILLFVDADVIYAPDAVRAAVAHLVASGASMISLLPYFEMNTVAEEIAMPQLAMTVFTALPTWFSNRTRFAMLAIGGGPGNLLGRTTYEAIGGHAALRDAVIDDVALARLVRRNGGRTLAVRADDLVSLRMYHGLREIVEGFTKNSFSVFGRSYVATLLATIAMPLFHVMPYATMFVPSLRAVSLAIVAAITLTRLILFRSLRYGTLNAMFFHAPMSLLWGYIFLRSAWITGIRRELRWRGRTYDATQTNFGAEARRKGTLMGDDELKSTEEQVVKIDVIDGSEVLGYEGSGREEHSGENPPDAQDGLTDGLADNRPKDL